MNIGQWLLSTIKIGGIQLTDALNKLPVKDPFDEFTRPAVVKDPDNPETLLLKAAKFEKDLEMFFVNDCIYSYGLPMPAGSPVDPGDQCIWHGVTTAMWAFKYSVTKDPLDLEKLRVCMKGLDMHQTVHGEPQRRLIRGFRPPTENERNGPEEVMQGPQLFIRRGDWWIEDMASNDSAGGHVLGIYFAWVYGDADIKKKAVILIKGIADELLNHDNALVLPSGGPTEFGALIQGWKTDPLRLALALTIYKMAGVMSGEAKYSDRYTSLVKTYRGDKLAAFAKVKLNLLSLDTTADSHRAAFCLSILGDLETNADWKGNYLAGLQRTWDVVHKGMNVWIALLNARHNHLDAGLVGNLKIILSEFTAEDKLRNVEQINSKDKAFWVLMGVKFVTVKGHLRATQPLPSWKMGSQDFFWQRNRNSVDDWIGSVEPSCLHNGVDFLLAYWLGRNLNLINGNE